VTTPGDLSSFSLWDLFRAEVETHSTTLNEGLLALEQHPADLDRIKALMRAAHSIKGAARVVQHSAAVDVAHAMEDRLVAAQEGRQALSADDIQNLLDGVDLLGRLSPPDETSRDAVVATVRADAEHLVGRLRHAPAAGAPVASAPTPLPQPPLPQTQPSLVPPREPDTRPPSEPVAGDTGDRAIRLTAQTVNRLMGLAGEAVVGTRWLEPFAVQLQAIKRELADISSRMEQLELALYDTGVPDEVSQLTNDVQDRINRARVALTEQQAELEQFSLRQDTLSARLYREVIATRMRPFSDLAASLPRLVRDLSKQLGKRVRLDVQGQATDVDRDVASLMDAPLIHVVRNAVDHGIEAPDARTRAGKPETGTITVSAHHVAGILRIEVRDDGRGVNVESLRQRIVERGLTDPALAERLSTGELVDFLFLPGFSTAERVTEISGRGVGLDVALTAMKSIGGRIETINEPGRGFSIRFDLPVSLSVLRALVVEVAGEPYGIPLPRIERVAVVSPEEIRTAEGREYITLQMERRGSAGIEERAHEKHVGIVTARQVLGIKGSATQHDEVALVVFRHGNAWFGLAVDRILHDEMVVVRPLDPRLGKVRDVSAGGLRPDGNPLLILDVDDVARSIEQILEGGRLARVGDAVEPEPGRRKRVLVVDDSITVREVERQLLEVRGYAVDVAVDGIDGWNAVRTGHYDLVVSDVDMPRLDGIGLVRRIRGDRQLATVPVIIVSYKDREEDRLRGLDAGASYYLTKASFQDDTFLHAVDELIGGPED